jgi:hypothetical protein
LPPNDIEVLPTFEKVFENTLVSQIIISKGKCISLVLSAEGLGNSTKTLPGTDKT